MKPLLLVIALSIGIAPCPAAAHPDLLLSTDHDSYYCALGHGVLGTVYVIWSNWSGEAKSLAFGAALSPNSGYVVEFSYSPFNVTGDAESGFLVDFGSCFQGSVTVMQFILVPISAGTPCSSFKLTPHPAYGGVRYVDCNNVPHRAERSVGVSLNSTGDCTDASVPYDPYPADGATNVPVSIDLEWSFDEPQCGDISGREDTIFFGTVPNPPFHDIWGGDPYPLQTLQPSKTYYWRVQTRAYGLYGSGPVWSFTTASTVATKQTTWVDQSAVSLSL